MTDNNTNPRAVTPEEIILAEYYKIINKYPNDHWLKPELAMKEAHTIEMLTNCMKEYAAPYISKLKEKDREIKMLYEDFRPFADYCELELKYEALKSKADKLEDALKKVDDATFMHDAIPYAIREHIQGIITPVLSAYHSENKK